MDINSHHLAMVTKRAHVDACRAAWDAMEDARLEPSDPSLRERARRLADESARRGSIYDEACTMIAQGLA